MEVRKHQKNTKRGWVVQNGGKSPNLPEWEEKDTGEEGASTRSRVFIESP